MALFKSGEAHDAMIILVVATGLTVIVLCVGVGLSILCKVYGL